MTDEGNKETPMVPKIRFVYQKARHHRTLHADGAWAGVTPQLEVQLALFNDLRLMPEYVTNLITAEGGVGDEISKGPSDTEMPGNVLREVDVTIIVSRNTAKNLIDVLSQMVKQIDEHIESIKNRPSIESTVNESEAS